MSGQRSLRRIGDPVVAAAPAGVRIRTRIRVAGGEAEALTAIGNLLGSVYRTELAGRIRLGRLDRKSHALWRAERKQALTAVSSSRWAGAGRRPQRRPPGHLAACVLDASGNPIGEPASIEVVTAGLAASRRDGRVRAAITALLDQAHQGGCAAIAIENLATVGSAPAHPGWAGQRPRA